MPLSFSSQENAPAIIKSVEDEVEALKRSGSLPPGLAEQYDIQLKNLRDEQIADCEVVAVPWFFAGNGMLSQFYTRFWKINERISAPPEQGKKHVTFSNILNHPFSRGSIVHYSTTRDVPITNNAI